MVTSISINSHLPHVLFTGCRFLPFNFIAARQLRRASSLMRFCTVVGSHNSCNFLWYLRYQITRCIRPADLVLGFRTYRWFTKGFPTSLAFGLPFEFFSASTHFCFLFSLPTLMSFPGPPGTYKGNRIAFVLESLGNFFAWGFEVPLLT